MVKVRPEKDGEAIDVNHKFNLASACNAGDLGSIPGLGRSPGEGNGYPLQYSCLENPIDRGTWWATDHRVAKSQTQLSDEHFHFRWLIGTGLLL